MKPINFSEKLAAFSGRWQPHTIAQFNSNDVMLVKAQGTCVWHQHDETDDLFIVLKDRLRMKLRTGEVVIGAGEMFVVPRGVEHCPAADEEVHLLIMEPRGTPNTGDPSTAQPRRAL